MTSCPLCHLGNIVPSEPCPNCGALAVDRARLTAIAARRWEISNAQRAFSTEDGVLAVEARETDPTREKDGPGVRRARRRGCASRNEPGKYASSRVGTRVGPPDPAVPANAGSK